MPNRPSPARLLALALSGFVAGGNGSAVPAKTLRFDHKLSRGEVQQIGDWLVGCDNGATCTMIGFPAPIDAVDGDGPALIDMGLRITVSGQADTPPVVELLPFAAPSVAPRVLFTLPGHAGPVHGYSRVVLAPADASYVLGTLANGGKVAGVDPDSGRAAVRFPSDRFGRAHAAMRSRREALLREKHDRETAAIPGELPDGTDMPSPDLPHRRIATPLIVSGFAPILAAGKCGSGGMRDVKRFRYSGGPELWGYRCGDGAHSSRTFWEMATGDSLRTAPLDLPEPRDGRVRAGVEGLEGAVFDFDFGILRSYRYQPGREDCGTFRAWGFTGQGWLLLERREMPLCKGLEPADWIRTHHAATHGGGPDE